MAQMGKLTQINPIIATTNAPSFKLLKNNTMLVDVKIRNMNKITIISTILALFII